MKVSCRSYDAIFLVPFTAVWAGASLSGFYGSQIIKGEFSLYLSLFGLPFLIGSMGLIKQCLLSVFGRTVISSTNGKALVFIGVGSIGMYYRFLWSEIDKVVEDKRYIVLEGSRRIIFGRELNSNRQFWLVNFLKSKLEQI